MPSIKENCLRKRSAALENQADILADSRVYLSGPMDFVSSRAEEKEHGWRNRVSQFLAQYRVTVYDPWNKPDVLGMPHYGKEDEFSTNKRQEWNYNGQEGEKTRARLCAEFWATAHIDLRMVDSSDFLVAFVPTNVYSVGTVHEIVQARQQHKPVLFVTPYLDLPEIAELQTHLDKTGDAEGAGLFASLQAKTPLRDNEKAAPSMWYMALVEAHYFFDGFGFHLYADKFGWSETDLDKREKACPPKRPLLPYIEALNKKIPLKYDAEKDAFVENSDWLLFENKG